MKRYQLKRKMDGEKLAATDIPVWPTFEHRDPDVNEAIYRFFDRNGNYKGWCSKTEGHKFLMGKLYYKTKGAYRIRSRKSYDDRSIRKIFVYEKGNNNLAAYVVFRAVTNEDLIEKDDREQLAKISREHMEAFSFTPWNIVGYPNKYKIIPEEFKTKIQKDLQKFMDDKKLELLNYLDTQILDAQRAKQLTAANAVDTGGDWNPSGLV